VKSLFLQRKKGNVIDTQKLLFYVLFIRQQCRQCFVTDHLTRCLNMAVCHTLLDVTSSFNWQVDNNIFITVDIKDKEESDRCGSKRQKGDGDRTEGR
jgi:hypothetical protein